VTTTTASLPLTRQRIGTGKAALVWTLFLLIALGLGYPTLNRYDARELGPDWQVYYKMVTGQATQYDAPFCYRVLVPELARPIYLAARGRVRSWNPVFFGLLVSNCLFCATATLLLLLLGLRVLGNLPVALLACALYLLNYVVPNLWLSGMVDSAEACLMLAVMLALFTRRWWVLPLIGVLGGLAKQSFLPFSVIFAAAWWLALPKTQRHWRQLIWVAGMGLTSAAAMMLVYRFFTGQFLAPWGMVEFFTPSSDLFTNAVKELTDQQFWYAYVWLLPLGLVRLKRLPRPWVTASAVTAVFTLGLGAWVHLMGTVNRPLYSIVGPVLVISAASLLAENGNAAGRVIDRAT
jgi:uncharacterized membrane protein